MTGMMRAIALMASATLALPAPLLRAQTVRWTLDPKSSLAWWQVSPHLNHLWGTTCPNEPSWRPGEDRFSGPGTPPTGYAAIMDTVHVPLYPRPWALPLCETGLRGEVVMDTAHWSTVRGLIVLSSKALTSGQPLRDDYAQKLVLNTTAYPDIRFTIDSLTDVRPGDTLHAKVVGTFEFRGHPRPMVASAIATREGGGLRVQARFDIPSNDLHEVYGVSKLSLGLGIGIWQILHLGVDVVLKAQPS